MDDSSSQTPKRKRKLSPGQLSLFLFLPPGISDTLPASSDDTDGQLQEDDIVPTPLLWKGVDAGLMDRRTQHSGVPNDATDRFGKPKRLR